MTEYRLPRWPALLAAAVLAAGAAGVLALSGDDGTSPTASPGTTVPAPGEVPDPAVDWRRPALVDLGGGWAVTDTEGDGPLVTVLRDGRPVGLLEFLDFPLETAAGGDERAALDAHVARYLESIGGDRAAAPVEGYGFSPDAAVHLRTADGAAVRYGFRGTLPDGRPSERTIQWAGIRGGRLVLVGASAHDEGGLFAREGSEFTSADLDAVAERLDRLVRASGLPEPAAR